MDDLNLDNLDIYIHFAWNNYTTRPFPFDVLSSFLIRPPPSVDEDFIQKWVKLANDVMFYGLPEMEYDVIREFVTFLGLYSRSLPTLVKIATFINDEPYDDLPLIQNMSAVLDQLKPLYKDYRIAADYIVHLIETQSESVENRINDDALDKMLEFANDFKDFEFIAYIYNKGSVMTQVLPT